MLARGWIRFLAVAVIACVTLPPAVVTAAKGSRPRAHLDAKLREAVTAGRLGRQRVIVRVREGAEPRVRQSLLGRGHAVLSGQTSLHALTASVSGGDLEALSELDGVEGVSIDAVVQSAGGSGPSTPLTGLLGSVVGTILDPVINTKGKGTSGKTLNQSDGSDVLTGAGVTVAVIDSGLELSLDFHGRLTASTISPAGPRLPGRPSTTMVTGRTWLASSGDQVSCPWAGGTPGWLPG